MHKDVQKVLFSAKEIDSRVREIGNDISTDFRGKNPLIIGILNGSFVFVADLVRQINGRCQVDFVAVSSYGSGTESTGRVKIIKDLSISVKDRDIILVDDILDSGNTLYYLCQVLKERGPASISFAVLLDKPSRRVKPITANYTGFEIPDEFVVGYGLDYDDKYRNLDFIGVLKPEIYNK